MPANNMPALGHVHAILRYPIKGIGGQHLPSIRLHAGSAIAGDRLLALAKHASPAIDQWKNKNHFHHLVDMPTMGQWRCDLDLSTDSINLIRNHDIALRTSMDRNGKRKLAEFFHQELHKNHPNRAFAGPLVECRQGSFADRKTQGVSILNLETVREISRRVHHDLDPLRFRANFYIEGGSAWGEEKWIGRRLMIHNVVLNVIEPIFRCPAIHVAPGLSQAKGGQAEGGQPDINILKTLNNLPRPWVGVLAQVETEGIIRTDDAVCWHGHQEV